MKRTIVVLILGCIVSFAVAKDEKNQPFNISLNKLTCINDAEVSVKYGVVLITSKWDDNEVVEITEDYDLYVNDRYVDVDDDQRELLGEYYEQVMNVIDEAKRVGLAGAKVGIQGAKIGLKAVAGVFKLILPGYDSDDLERELEYETEGIEEMANDLEEDAEGIEELADDLEDLHEELKDEIPALESLDWF